MSRSRDAFWTRGIDCVYGTVVTVHNCTRYSLLRGDLEVVFSGTYVSEKVTVDVTGLIFSRFHDFLFVSFILFFSFFFSFRFVYSSSFIVLR